MKLEVQYDGARLNRLARRGGTPPSRNLACATVSAGNLTGGFTRPTTNHGEGFCALTGRRYRPSAGYSKTAHNKSSRRRYRVHHGHAPRTIPSHDGCRVHLSIQPAANYPADNGRPPKSGLESRRRVEDQDITPDFCPRRLPEKQKKKQKKKKKQKIKKKKKNK